VRNEERALLTLDQDSGQAEKYLRLVVIARKV
jgi:hypothetical protein